MLCVSQNLARSEVSENKHSENQRKIICFCNKLKFHQLHVAMLAEIHGHLYRNSTKHCTGSFVLKQHQTLYRVMSTEAAINIILGHLYKTAPNIIQVICSGVAPNIIQVHLYRSSAIHYAGSSVQKQHQPLYRVICT